MRVWLWRRQASSTPGASLVIAVTVFLAAMMLTIWPRLIEQIFADEVDHQIAGAGATQRAILGEFLQPQGFMAHDPESIAGTLTDLAAGAGPHLRPVMQEPRFSVTSQAPLEVFPAADPTPALARTFLQLRLDLDITDFVEVVEGSLPAPLPATDDPLEWLGGVDGQEAEPADIMISVGTAERLGLQLGEELTLPVFDGQLVMRVSGLFAPLDPAADQWQHQLNTVEPLWRTDPNASDSVEGIGYLHPDNADWLAMVGGATVRMWIPVDTTDAPTDDPEALLADLRTITATEHVMPAEGPDQDFALDSSLVPILQTAVDRWQGTATVLTMIAAGPLGVLAAVLALATRLAVTRRQATLALTTARGGSGTQVRSALAVEGLVLGLPAAALGAVLATVLVPGPIEPAQYVGAAAVTVAPALFLATSPLPNLRTTRADLSRRSSSPVRWALEVLVLGAAAGAVYLTLDRGLVTEVGPDLLSIATPLLLSVAVAVIAVRLFPLPLIALHRGLRRRRSLAGFLGSARSIREGHAPFVPVLALLVGISIAVFSSVMLTTLRTGTETAGFVEAGADVRISGPVLPEEQLEEITRLDGVAAVAPVSSAPNTALGEGTQQHRLSLIATDTEALRQVQTEVPGALDLPAGMYRLDGDRLPLIASAGVDVTDPDDVRLVGSPSVDATLVAEAEQATGLTVVNSWVLGDLDLIRERTGRALAARLALIGLQDDADALEVIAQVEEITDHAGVVTSPAQNVEQFLSSPSASSLERGFALALVITTALAMAAIVLTLVLAAPARGRLMAVLRTLGAGPRIARALVAWETLPLVVVAVVFGTLLGLGLPQLLAGAVDLRPFTGGEVQPELIYSPLLITGVVGAVGAMLTVSVLIAGAIARRLSLSVLRIGVAS